MGQGRHYPLFQEPSLLDHNCLPSPSFGDTINPVQGIYAGTAGHPACEGLGSHLLLPYPGQPQWPQGDRGSLADTDLPTSKPSRFQMFFHLRPDVASVPSFSRRIYFWVPSHHPLPSNFMLNKAHSLALLLGSELLGFDKAELRRGNGGA